MSEIINVEELTEEKIAGMIGRLGRVAKPSHRTRKSPDLYDIVCAFDIETTSLPAEEIGFCYSWAFQFGLETTIIGRTIDTAVSLFKRLSSHCKENTYLSVYVHNLSFEFQFLKGVYKFDTDSIFATSRRKIVRASMFEHIELRCSYFLTNMSLAKFTEVENAEHAKLSGEEFDYSKKRYPWTELTSFEWQYQINDVLGLVESIYHLMHKTGDTLLTIPMTNTGYVRRDVKGALASRRFDIIRLLPDSDLYIHLRRAFRGGNTHASRFRAGHIESNVHNIDIASSYPAVMLNCLFPIKPFIKVKDPDFDSLKWLRDREKAILLKVSLWDVCLKDNIPVPYLNRSKLYNAGGSITEDNGRILHAEYGELYLTDIDFDILLDQYQFEDIRIDALFYSTYGKLPDELLEVVMKYYRDKTSLKGIDDYFYMKSKNRLNSCYGMAAQDPCRDDIVFNDETNELEEEEKSIELCLREYAKNPTLPYQWGVWVTAWARKRLQELIDHVPWNRFCYCDTDSVKYIGEKIDFYGWNNQRMKESEEGGFVAKDRKDQKHYIGIAEEEDDYKQFATLGAKKYVYIGQDNKIHITIAGVNKKKGAEELQRRGGIKAFKEGFLFSSGGGTESVYNDNFIKVMEIDGHTLIVNDNICIRPSTYKIGLTDDYRNILSQENIDFIVKKELLQ